MPPNEFIAMARAEGSLARTPKEYFELELKKYKQNLVGVLNKREGPDPSHEGRLSIDLTVGEIREFFGDKQFVVIKARKKRVS